MKHRVSLWTALVLSLALSSSLISASRYNLRHENLTHFEVAKNLTDCNNKTGHGAASSISYICSLLMVVLLFFWFGEHRKMKKKARILSLTTVELEAIGVVAILIRGMCMHTFHKILEVVIGLAYNAWATILLLAMGVQHKPWVQKLAAALAAGPFLAGILCELVGGLVPSLIITLGGTICATLPLVCIFFTKEPTSLAELFISILRTVSTWAELVGIMKWNIILPNGWFEILGLICGLWVVFSLLLVAVMHVRRKKNEPTDQYMEVIIEELQEFRTDPSEKSRLLTRQADLAALKEVTQSINKAIEELRNETDRNPHNSFETLYEILNASGSMEPLKLEFLHIDRDGDIGCIYNDRIIGQYMLEMIKQRGGNPVSVVNIGEDKLGQKFLEAFKHLVLGQNLRIILILMTGIDNECGTIARNILTAIQEVQVTIPIVVHLQGFDIRKAKIILEGGYEAVVVTTNLKDAFNMLIQTSGTDN